MDTISIQLDSTSIGASEAVDFVTVVDLREETEVEVIAWFEAEIGRSRIETEPTPLFQGALPRGLSKIPSTVTAPNGPFDYIGQLMKVVWSLEVELRPVSGDMKRARVAISLQPTALVSRSDTPPQDALTTLEPGMGNAILNAVAAGAALPLLTVIILSFVGVDLTKEQYVAVAFWGFAIVFLGTLSIRAPAQVGNYLGGKFDVEIEPEVATQGGKVRATVTNQRQSIVPLNRVEVRFRVFERALVSRGDSVEWATYELEAEEERRAVTGRHVEMTFEFELPQDLPASVESKYASIVWGLDVRVDLGFAPDWKKFFPFAVGAPPARITDESNPVAR